MTDIAHGERKKAFVVPEARIAMVMHEMKIYQKIPIDIHVEVKLQNVKLQNANLRSNLQLRGCAGLSRWPFHS